MCNLLNLDVQPPTKALELAIPAINDFLRDPSDWNRYEALDWMLRCMLGPKWAAYSSARRVSACREENGTEHDEIVELQG